MGDSEKPAESPVSVTFDEGIALLRLSRPEARNALDTNMVVSLAGELRGCLDRPDIRCVVITGGTRIFASGADIRELGETRPTDLLTAPKDAAWQQIFSFPLPVVSAVAGYVLGGGCELAFSGDFVIAGDNAVFGQPEARIGIMPGAGGTQRWARAAGRYLASQVNITARFVTAWEALRMGIVAEVVPTERVVEAAMGWARRIAAVPPLATRSIKVALRAAESMPIREAMRYEKTMMATLLATDDAAEGMGAFLEKRQPTFRGR
jgi:enoyl-CoA hydratase/carnithine racemase